VLLQYDFNQDAESWRKETMSKTDLAKIDLTKVQVIDFSKFLKTIDLRPQIGQMGLGVRSQGGRGTCSVFASTFLVEFKLSQERSLTGMDLSEEYLNAVTNRATGRTDDGDFFSSISEGYKSFGVVDEVWCQYKTTYDPNFQPDNELLGVGEACRFYKTDLMISANLPAKPGFSDVQLAAILKQLDNGVPVAIGFNGSSGTTTISVGGLSVMDDLSNDIGPYGHSVPIVGYRSGPLISSGGYVIFRNSYGPSWGDSGYGYMSFNYLKKYTNDAIVYDRSPQFLPPTIQRVKLPVERIRYPPPITLETADLLGKLIHPASRLIVQPS